MTLAGILFNGITALITALSRGLGVGYTSRIIHRYEEEFTHLRDPAAAAELWALPTRHCWARP